MRALARGDTAHFGEGSVGELPLFELGGKTMGLIGGAGAIGRRVAELARALGMTVLVYSRRGAAAGAGRGGGACEYVSLNELLARSDFVSVHCPLTAATRGLLGAVAFGAMKRGACVINTARGPVVDEVALRHALGPAGTLGGACLDVQDPEPPPAGSWLYGHPKVVLTPHLGWRRLETRQRLLGLVAGNVRAYASGTPINVVKEL
jgi:glycerate dehydrogenase